LNHFYELIRELVAELRVEPRDNFAVTGMEILQVDSGDRIS
jgi:hypothetical protein